MFHVDKKYGEVKIIGKVITCNFRKTFSFQVIENLILVLVIQTLNYLPLKKSEKGNYGICATMSCSAANGFLCGA